MTLNNLSSSKKTDSEKDSAFFLSLSALSGLLGVYGISDVDMALFTASIYAMSSGLFLLKFGYEQFENKPNYVRRAHGAIYRLCIVGSMLLMQDQMKMGWFLRYCQILGIQDQAAEHQKSAESLGSQHFGLNGPGGRISQQAQKDSLGISRKDSVHVSRIPASHL